MNPVNPSSLDHASLARAFATVVRRRRSTYSYLDTPVPRELIEQALADAVLAPNHHRTSPWRFHVIPRDARGALESAYEAAALRVGRDAARARQRARDAPVNVVVACVPAVENPRVLVREEEFAVAAAVQNFLLSLSAAGLASLLTTGELAESSEVAQLVGLNAPDARVMGVINVGFRNTERPISARAEPPLDGVVRWLHATDFSTAL